MMLVNYTHADCHETTRIAFQLAEQDGWTVLLAGIGFHFRVLENYFKEAAHLYSSGAVCMEVHEPSLSYRFASGGEIKFVDFTPGELRGTVSKTQQADVIFLLEDTVGSMHGVLQRVLYPILERSAEHASIKIVGDRHGSTNIGEH